MHSRDRKVIKKLHRTAQELPDFELVSLCEAALAGDEDSIEEALEAYRAQEAAKWES